MNFEATLFVRKSPAAEALEEAVTWVLERVQKERDTDDVLSTDAEDDLPSRVSSTALRARARLRVHLKTLLVSTNIEMVKKALMLLGEASVRLATRQFYIKAKNDFLKFCDSLSLLVNVDDPCTAGAALCAYAIALIACGHHKPHFERSQAGILFHLPDLGATGRSACLVLAGP